MMLYRMCDNGRAVLVTRELIIPQSMLEVHFDSIDAGYTAIFENGGSRRYREISNGACNIPLKHIVTGPIKITVIKDDKTAPSYICDELLAVRRGDVVAISGNTLQYDELLAEMRCEMDELRADNALFKKELLQFREEFDRIYKGYEVL